MSSSFGAQLPWDFFQAAPPTLYGPYKVLMYLKGPPIMISDRSASALRGPFKVLKYLTGPPVVIKGGPVIAIPGA